MLETRAAEPHGAVRGGVSAGRSRTARRSATRDFDPGWWRWASAMSR